MTCTLHPMLRTSAEITCEAALFLNDMEKIKAKCNLRLLLNKIKPHILELPLSKICIYQTLSFTLRCRDNDKRMKGCNYCMMTIPCQCTVIGNNIQFDQKIILCNNETRDTTTLYPVNIAVIQQFFNDSQLRKVLADASFNNSIDIKIPPFKIYEHKMSNIFAEDDSKYSLNLRKMANRAKKDQVIFSNLAESLVEGEVEIDDDDWPKTNDILIILALSLTSLNLIAIIWLVYKVRVLGCAILLAKNLSTVHAFTLQYTIPTTTAPPSWSAVLTENIKWDHIVFVFYFVFIHGND